MSTIDELNRLHEAATKGEWKAVQSARPCVETRDGQHDVVDTSSSGMEGGGFAREEDANLVVALHNAWPAIHRVLVAARKWMNTDTGDFDADCAADRELGEALRALDNKEQRT